MKEKSGDRPGREVGETAQAMHHGDDKLFDLLGLHLCLGEELGGTKTQLRHLVVRDLAAGVDDEGEGTEGGLFAKPLDKGESVPIRKGEVKNQQVRATCEAAANSLPACGGVLDGDVGLAKAGDDDAGEVLVIFDEKNLRWALTAA